MFRSVLRPLRPGTRRGFFNFLKKREITDNKDVTAEAQETQVETRGAGDLQIREEETKVLWDLYQPREEEGLDVFKGSLSNQIQEFKTVVEDKALKEMTEQIDKTNRQL
jgi:hypothetical protein